MLGIAIVAGESPHGAPASVRERLPGEARRERIAQRIDEDGAATVVQLETLFKVSGATIRRDLDRLADAKRIARVHGGAVRHQVNSGHIQESFYENDPDSQAAITRLLLLFLSSGETVLIEGGQQATACALAIGVDPDLELGLVVTSSLSVLRAFTENDPAQPVMLLGGELRKGRTVQRPTDAGWHLTVTTSIHALDADDSESSGWDHEADSEERGVHSCRRIAVATGELSPDLLRRYDFVVVDRIVDPAAVRNLAEAGTSVLDVSALRHLPR